MRCPGDGLPEYSTADIQVLEGLEPIRRRPAMFIGDTGGRGLHHMLFGLVDESLAAGARAVSVTLGIDGFAEVVDDRDPPAEVEFLFTRFATLHGGWATAIANALSAELTAVARTPGSTYQHTFRRGVTHAVLQSGGPPEQRGLTARFRPDPDIFGATRFNSETIRERLRQCAFLHSGVRITFTDEAAGTRDEFEYADGIAGYVRRLNADRTPLHPDAIVARGEADGVRYEVALQWCEEDGELVLTFANGYLTRLDGTHESGLRTALTRAVNEHIRHQPGAAVVKDEDARSGLTAVVSVCIHDIRFAGATQDRLSNPEAEHAVAAGVGSALRVYFEANPAVAEAVVRGAETARAAREAARAARGRK